MSEVFLTCVGFDVKGTLEKIKRSSDCMAPIYEALSNSFDATDELIGADASTPAPPVVVSFEFSTISPASRRARLDSVEIKDGGAGFAAANYKRFLSLNDRSKGALNKGSGRVQFIKAFDVACYESVFRDESGALMRRAFSISESERFAEQNALVCESEPARPYDGDADAPFTILRLIAPSLDAQSQRLEKSTLEDIKQRILAKFFIRLQTSRNPPRVDVLFRTDGKETERATITRDDLVAPKKIIDVPVRKKFLRTVAGTPLFFETDEFETFKVAGYEVTNPFFKENLEAFVSRGEKVADAELNLAKKNETLGGVRYVVAISGARIDSGVLETRDGLSLPRDRDFQETPLFDELVADVSLEDVRDAARKACADIFPELREKKDRLEQNLFSVGKRLGFPRAAVDAVKEKLPLNATTKDILKQLYDRETAVAAKNDASIYELIDAVKKIDPTTEEGVEELRKQACRLYELTPEQNKNALAHYCARRKVTLDLLGETLKGALDVQTRPGKRKEESILHNILFSRRSHDPASSALWLLNEEYVYYSGVSDVPLTDVEYAGKKILAPVESFGTKDREFIKKEKNRRPDILLFPKEGKCVVVELKAPDVDLVDCVTQTYRYASILYNYAAPELNLTQFYLYLIGGDFNALDVRTEHPEYIPAENFGYMFASQKIASNDPKRPDVYAHAEIHTYRSFYERAALRNKIFLDLLLNGESSEL